MEAEANITPPIRVAVRIICPTMTKSEKDVHAQKTPSTFAAQEAARFRSTAERDRTPSRYLSCLAD